MPREGKGNNSRHFGVESARTCYIRGYPRGRRFLSQTGRSHWMVVRGRQRRSCAHRALPCRRRDRARGARLRAPPSGARARHPPAGRPRRGARSVAGGVLAGLPHPPPLPRRSRRCAPGSSGSSSTRCGTGSAGGGGASGRIRYRSTSTFAITARWCWAPMRRRPIAS